MFLVAVTGGIATGKSTVSKVFERNGIAVIDADKIARQIVEPGKPAWKQIREVFGDDVLLITREINREALGKLIFANKELRRKLNSITHPIIHREIFIQVFKYFMSGRSYVVLDLPLLFETGILMDFIYKIITVTCDSENQLERLLKRKELSEVDARNRIASQMPLLTKCEKSHFVIDNSKSISNTEKAAEDILHILNKSNQHWKNRIFMLGIFFAILLMFYYLNRFFNFLPSWE